MTVRTNHVDGDIVIYAGTAEELGAVAGEYASGARRCPYGYQPGLFERAAELLRTGRYPALDLGAVRFYRDRPSGKPYRGPYAPSPDEGWERQQRSLGVLLRG